MASQRSVGMRGNPARFVTVRTLLRWGVCVSLTALAVRLPAQHGVLTQHNDNGRTGAYLFETQLTPRSVDAATGPGMRLRYELWAGGVVNAQPLYVSRLRMVDKSVHNVLFTATMANTVSAWDADSGVQLWNVTLRDGSPNSGRTLTREGVFSTPVISGTTMYLVYNTWNGVSFPPDGADPPPSVDLQFWITALDIRTGHIFHTRQVAGQAPSRVAPKTVKFVARRHMQRPALLLAPDPTRTGVNDVYVGFGSRWHEEKMNYHGWVFRFNAHDLSYKGCFCATPDRREFSEGAGVWQGGAGLAADAQGAVYFCTGNGDSNTGAYGNGIVKLTPTRDQSGQDQLTALGFNARKENPARAVEWDENDIDLGSGGAILIPGTQNVLGGGKTGVLYLLGTANMKRIQKIAAANNSYISDPGQYDSNRFGDGPDPLGWGAWAMGPQLLGAPVFWQGANSSYGWVYAWGEKDAPKSLHYYWNRPNSPLDVARMGRDAAGIVRAPLDVSPGGSLSLSANGTQDGILWATSPTDTGARLLAFDAETLRKLWEEPLPSVGQFVPPTVADGKVFVVTADGHFRAYELASAQPMVALPPAPTLVPLGNPAPRVAMLLRRLGPAAERFISSDAAPLFVAPAMGERVYVCQPRADLPGRWEWVLRRTTETLIDEVGTRPSRIYQGRGQTLARQVGEATWESYDGSRIVGQLLTSAPAPTPGALPWLFWQRINPAPTDRKDVLSPVTYIQRLDTQGGLPPRQADAIAAGKELRVPYIALYVFYGPVLP